MSTPPIAEIAQVSDLLDVFQSYGGGVIFQGLTGSSGVLGQIGWIFTAFGAFFVLWGFMLRSRGAGVEDKAGEIIRTWIVIGFMVGGPTLMRWAMQAADGIYSSTIGGPRNLVNACAKAAYAMPDVGSLAGTHGNATPDNPAGAGTGQGAAPTGGADGLGGDLKAYVGTFMNGAIDFSKQAVGIWTETKRKLDMLSGFASGLAKYALVWTTLEPLYFLFMASAGLLWFMEQLRFFLAVVGTMMLPFFVGMFSLPAGHPNRSAAQAYVMHLISLALWPVAWAIGHTVTIVLYDALISMIAGTSRVPAVADVLQWSAITSADPAVSEQQVRAIEAALGNWFMGNAAAVLGLLVGGIGFAFWVFAVSVFGPVFLHKMLTSGSMYMSEAISTTGRQAFNVGKLGLGAVEKAGRAVRGGPAVPGGSSDPPRPNTRTFPKSCLAGWDCLPARGVHAPAETTTARQWTPRTGAWPPRGTGS